MNLTTVQRVNDRREADATDSETLITRLIEDVSADLEEYMNRGALAEARTEVFVLYPGDSLITLYAYPVTTVTSVHYSADRTFDADEAYTSGDDYLLNAPAGTIELIYPAMLVPVSYVQVVYTGGLAASTAELIADYPLIAAACDDQVLATFRRSAQPDARKTALQGGAMDYEKALDLMPQVRRRLDRYRRRVL